MLADARRPVVPWYNRYPAHEVDVCFVYERQGLRLGRRRQGQALHDISQGGDLVAEGLGATAATAAFSARGIENQLSGSDYLQLLVGGTTAAALWATIGLGIGALVRNQVGTLVGLCAWILLVENLIAFDPGASQFAPGVAGLALAGKTGAGFLAPAAAALLLVLYAAAVSAAGWLATLRRDIA